MSKKTEQIEKDALFIKEFGGSTKLARALGFDTPAGISRVHMWITRGIPSYIKLEYPKIFLRKAKK